MPTYVYDGSPLANLSPAPATIFDTQFWTIQGTFAANVFNMTGVISYSSLPSFYLNAGDDSFTGSDQAEEAYGGDGNDTLQGNGGNDLLEGGAGDDALYGGDGDDTLYASDGDDSYSGGDGWDVLDIAFLNSFASLTLDAAASVEHVRLDWWELNGTSAANTFDLTGVSSYSGMPTFNLDAGTDSFLGSEAAEWVYGGDGNDTLQGNGGNDTLDGDGGDDALYGGDGDDTLAASEGDDSYFGGAGWDVLDTYWNILSSLTLDAAASVESVEHYGFAIQGTSGANSFDLTGVTLYSSLPTFQLDAGADSFAGSGAEEHVYGQDDNDTLRGNGGNDRLDGGAGDDALYGGDGDDTLAASEGVDSFSGGDGLDMLDISSWNSFASLTLDAAASVESVDVFWSTIQGTSGANSFDLTGVTSYSALPSFYLNAGDDSFDGSDQAEEAYGGDGNDTLRGNGGNDLLEGGDGDDALYGGDGDDTLYASDGDDSYSGGDGWDVLHTYWNSFASLTLDAATSVEHVQLDWWELNGTSAANTFDLTGVSSYSGMPTFNLDAGTDSFLGSEAAEWVHGGDGNDTLQGNGGNDTLEGGNGDDALHGGDGDDRLHASDGVDGYFGGAGWDVFENTWDRFASLTLDAAASVEEVDLFWGSGLYGTAGANVFDLTGVQSYSQFPQIYLDAGHDSLRGAEASEAVDGEDGNDTLQGNGGNDILDGGAGDDSLQGGDGADALQGGGGLDRLEGGAGDDSLQGGDGADLLQGGEDNDRLEGNAGNDTLEGGAGSDTLIASEGNDAYFGGDDWDVFSTEFIDAFTSLTLDAAASVEWVNLAWSASIYGTSGANAFDMTGVGAYSVRPEFWLGAGADSFTGSEQAELVNGEDGKDTLRGNGGNDLLDGGAGDDALYGGDGDDTLATSEGNDSYSGGDGWDVLRTDWKGFASLTLDAAASVEHVDLGSGRGIYGTSGANAFDLTGVAVYSDLPEFWLGAGADSFTGSEQAELVNGDEGNDRLDGRGGNDTLQGGDGNDTLVASAGRDRYFGGSGQDVLEIGADSFHALTLTAAASVEVVDLAGHAIHGTAAANSFTLSAVTAYVGVAEFWLGEGADSLLGSGQSEEVHGEGGNDRIDTEGGSDWLFGGDGDDRLNGGAGIDMMLGGAGNDTYIVNTAADLVLETTTQTSGLDAGGLDTVQSLVSFSLAGSVGLGFVEALRLSGSANINATGNGLDNLLTGNGGNNRLDGGTGNDTMLGGDGNDTYVVDSAGDQVFETTTQTGTVNAGGVDTVQSGVTFSLAASTGLRFVEHLTLTGSADIDATGNSRANWLTGNAGANVLNGGLGADTMEGGAGADVFVFDSTLGGGNSDRIRGFELGLDQIHLDDAVFAGLAPGALDGAAFTANRAGTARDALHRVIYETDTGRLYYDADGDGTGARVQFATLASGLALSAADFLVI